jgi:glycosyltransferase involved in cell wall biosynthesis
MILYIAYLDNSVSGGSIRVLETILYKLRENNISFSVLFIYGSTGIINAEFNDNCYYLNSENGKGYKSFIKFYKLYKKIRPKIIHLIDPIYWVQILLLFLRSKSVLHVHGAHWNRKLFIKLNFLWIISKICIDRFITITYGSKDSLIYNFSVNKNKIEIVYNAVNTTKITETHPEENIKLKFNIPDNCKIIGSVGRVVQARGFEDLIKLLNHLGENWHVLIIGDGDYKEDLLNLAKKLNLSNRVHFTGFVNNVIPYYKIMDIYGFFARYESFGLALADAMLLKIPIFGLKGAGEYYDSRNPLVKDNNSSFIERPDILNQWREEIEGTIIELSILIKDYENNPINYELKKENAFQNVIQNFNSEIQFYNLMKVYNKLR